MQNLTTMKCHLQSTVPVNVPSSPTWNLVALDSRAPSRMQAIEKALKLPRSIVDTAAYVLQRRVADIREKERQNKKENSEA